MAIPFVSSSRKFRSVGVLVAIFCLLVFVYDVLRPSFGVGSNYMYVAVNAALLGTIAILLRSRTTPALGPVTPPDRRVGAAGADPLLTLRAFACLLVLLGHYFAVVFPVGHLVQTVQTLPLYFLLCASPWAGVWIFFVLSGYLMGKGFFSGRYGYDAAGLRRFYWNRLLRIYPIYASALIIVALLKMPQILSFSQGWNLLQSLLFAGSGTQVASPIGALWSISTECQFYLAAPFLAVGIEWSARRVDLRVLLAGVLLAGLCARSIGMGYFELIWPFTIYRPFVWNLDLFIAGMMMAKLIVGAQKRPSDAGAGRLLLGLSAFPVFYLAIAWSGALSVFRNSGWNAYMSLWPFLSALFTTSVIYLFETSDRDAARRRWPTAFRAITGTQMFGILTYCIYVWHEPVFLALRSNLPEVLKVRFTFAMIAPALGMTVLVASFFYWLVERRFEKMKS